MKTAKSVSVELKLTVFFEDPFWVGVAERRWGRRLEVAKVTFGSEPQAGELYDFVLHQWQRLQFSAPTALNSSSPKTKINPKRLQRQVKRRVAEQGIGTKAQQALKAQQELQKQCRTSQQKVEKEFQRKQRFQQKQQQKKEKHKGR